MSDVRIIMHTTFSLQPRLYRQIGVAIDKYRGGGGGGDDHRVSLLYDVRECMKACQHPIRGFFIRWHLLNLIACDVSDKDGGFHDVHVIDLYMGVVKEMNSMWATMEVYMT
jgi:hypothetical protein